MIIIIIIGNDISSNDIGVIIQLLLVMKGNY